MTIYPLDCVAVMRGLIAPESVDAIVTDPPYELGFMGKRWDASGVAFDPETWRAAYAVLKPGAHLVAFSGTRTYHRMVCAIEDAGFEIRDQLAWVYGSGFPKSHNGEWGGTALKPAWEPIVLARKPLVGTVAANYAAHGVGGLNIEGCRIEAIGRPHIVSHSEGSKNTFGNGLNGSHAAGTTDVGRWPANLCHDGSDEVLECFPDSKQGGSISNRSSPKTAGIYGEMSGEGERWAGYADSGSAARFFYCAKASTAEREAGCDALPAKKGGMVSNTSGQHITRRDGGEPGPRRNHHPTVKPVALMRWLARLVTPPGGTVLDPFTGSGSTGMACKAEGFQFIGCELDAEYVAIAQARIDAYQV